MNDRCSCKTEKEGGWIGRGEERRGQCYLLREGREREDEKCDAIDREIEMCNANKRKKGGKMSYVMLLRRMEREEGMCKAIERKKGAV